MLRLHLDDLVEEAVVTSGVLVGVGLESVLEGTATVAAAPLVLEPGVESLWVESDELAVERSRRHARAADVRCDAHLHRTHVDGIHADEQRWGCHVAVLGDRLGLAGHGVEGVAELVHVHVGEHGDADHDCQHEGGNEGRQGIPKPLVHVLSPEVNGAGTQFPDRRLNQKISVLSTYCPVHL